MHEHWAVAQHHRHGICVFVSFLFCNGRVPLEPDRVFTFIYLQNVSIFADTRRSCTRSFAPAQKPGHSLVQWTSKTKESETKTNQKWKSCWAKFLMWNSLVSFHSARLCECVCVRQVFGSYVRIFICIFSLHFCSISTKFLVKCHAFICAVHSCNHWMHSHTHTQTVTWLEIYPNPCAAAAHAAIWALGTFVINLFIHED